MRRNLNRLATSVAVCLSIIVLTAATQDSKTDNASTASRFFDLAQYDSAIVYYEKAALDSESKQDWKSLAAYRTSIAETYRVMNNTQKSLEYLDGVYKICKEHLPGKTEELAKAYEINGRVADYNLRDFGKGYQYYDSSLVIRKSLYGNEHLTISENIYLIGRTYFFRGQMLEAEKFFNDAVAMKIKLGGENEKSLFDVYGSLATLNRRLLKMNNAVNFYKKADAVWTANKQPMDHPSIGMMNYGMGNLYIEFGFYEDAKTSYRKALTTFEKFFGEKDFRVATTYSNIGACYSNQLEYTNAVQYYTKARTIYEEVLPENHPFITAVYSDIGDMYNQFKKYDESVKYSARSVELMEKNQTKDTREYGYINMYHASTLLELGRLDEARKHADMAIDVLKKTAEQYLLSNAYTLSADVYHEMKADEKAEAHYQQAIALYKDTVNRAIYLGFSLAAYGEFKYETKQYQEALSALDKSLYQFSIENKDGKLKQLNDFQSVDLVVSALPVRGDVLLALYDTTGDESYLNEALNTYQFVTGLYERIIKENKSERSKLLQIPKIVSNYEKAVECALLLADKTKDDRYKQQAFSFAEQSKAIILWQYVHDSEARQFGKIPEAVTLEERRLKEKISFHEKKMDNFNSDGGFERNDSTGIALKDEYFKLRTSYDSLVKGLEEKYPDYYNLKYQRGDTDVTSISKGLKAGEAVIEYLTGDENVFAFLVTASGLEVFTLKNDADILRLTENLRESLISKDIDAYTKHASGFFDNFFQPIHESLQKQKITDVIIVPDGVISYVPFEALLRKNEQAPDVDSYSYLIHDYTFHYQYAAGLIPTYAQIAQQNSSGDLMAFAPTFGSTASAEKLSSLDFSVEEVENINELLGGDRFVGEEATEAAFKKNVQDYSIIHLATHAVLDDQDADRSRLHFSPSDSTEDGRLHAYELFNMTIPASLVTLSACNTGAGQFYKGEGVMSLSRAFAYAGCPSILTSLWQAQDRSTATLMHYFYENLSEGMNKAEALKLAKIRYLKESDKVKALPFFWAGFVLIGDDTPLKKSRTGLWMIVLGTTVVAFIVIGVSRSRKNRSKVA
jgi:CHAT domain-containing protein/Tfp pilus assembly protein PilF